MDYSDYFSMISTKEYEEISKIIRRSRESKISPTLIENDEDMATTVELNSSERNAANISSIKSYYYARVVHESFPYVVPIGSVNRFADYSDPTSSVVGTGLVMGYIYKGKIYHSNSELMAVDSYRLKLDISNYQFIYLLRELTKEGFGKIRAIRTDCLGRREEGEALYSKLLSMLTIKVVDYKLSSKVFGLVSTKEKLVGQVVKGVNMDAGKVSKLGSSTYYATVPIPQESAEARNVKFCIRDLEFTLPTIKGYSLPKDKTIKVGNIVRVVNNKNTNLILGKEYSVLALKPNNSSKRISARCNNKKLDIVTINVGGRYVNCYAKNLKLVR